MMRERTAPTAVRWLIALAACAALAWAAIPAWRAARTGDDLLAALQSVRIWPAESPPPLVPWASMWERLALADAVEPGNPSTAEFMGLLAARRYDDHARLQEATSHYLRALALRPISANTWANLAEARYLVGDTGPTFETAIVNAARLGPSQPQAQRVIAFYGLAVLDEVAPATRTAIEAMVAAGVRREPAEMLAIAHRRGRLDVACRSLPDTRRTIDAQWKSLCAESLGHQDD